MKNTMRYKSVKKSLPPFSAIRKPLHLTERQFEEILYKKQRDIKDLKKGQIPNGERLKTNLRTLNSRDLINRILEIRYYYNLTQSNLASLLQITQPTYAAIEAGKRHIDLDLVNQIAGVYGMEGWLFLREDSPFLAVGKLPEETKILVLQREKAGKKPRYFHNQLLDAVFFILNHKKLPQSFSSITIYNHLPQDKRQQCTLRNIIEAFNMSPIRDVLIDTGKRLYNRKLYKINRRKISRSSPNYKQ